MLLGHVDGTHVDLALQPEQGGCGRQRHAVLPRAGLRDQLLLAHPLGQQPLTQAVVDLVGTGVVEVLAFEVDLRPAEVPGQPGRQEQRRRAADVIGQQRLVFGLETGILAGLRVGSCHLGDGSFELRGQETTAVVPEEPGLVSVDQRSHVANAIAGRRGDCRRLRHRTRRRNKFRAHRRSTTPRRRPPGVRAGRWRGRCGRRPRSRWCRARCHPG